MSFTSKFSSSAPGASRRRLLAVGAAGAAAVISGAPLLAAESIADASPVAPDASVFEAIGFHRTILDHWEKLSDELWNLEESCPEVSRRMDELEQEVAQFDSEEDRALRDLTLLAPSSIDGCRALALYLYEYAARIGDLDITDPLHLFVASLAGYSPDDDA